MRKRPPEAEGPRLSREDKRRLNRRAARSAEDLVDELLELREHMLVQLPLGDELLTAVRDLRGMFGHKERPRHLRYVTRLVRDSDLDALSRALVEVKSGSGADTRQRKAQRWRERLLKEGDDAVQSFLEEHPSADRQALRTLVRKTQKAKPEEVGKLMVELARFLRRADAEASGVEDADVDEDLGADEAGEEEAGGEEAGGEQE